MSGAAAGLDFASVEVAASALMTIASVGAASEAGALDAEDTGRDVGGADGTGGEAAAVEAADADVGDAGVAGGDVRGADGAGVDVGDAGVTGADVAGRPPESAVGADPAARAGHPASAAPAVIARPRTAPPAGWAGPAGVPARPSADHSPRLWPRCRMRGRDCGAPGSSSWMTYA